MRDLFVFALKHYVLAAVAIVVGAFLAYCAIGVSISKYINARDLRRDRKARR